MYNSFFTEAPKDTSEANMNCQQIIVMQMDPGSSVL